MSNWEREKVGIIPVKNLWLLMLYASDCRYLAEHLADSEASHHDALELVGKVLCDLLESRMRRELSKSFINRKDELNRVRGRVDVLQSERKMSLYRGKVFCHFEEVSADTARNRYTLNALQKLQKLTKNKNLLVRSRAISHQLKQLGISDIQVVGYSPSSERFGRHEIEDRKIIQLAELIHSMMLISESMGSKLLPKPEKQEQWVRKLFEKAVAGFYKLTLPKQGWKVSSNKQLRWQVEQESTLIPSLLPTMELDIQLDHHQLKQRIVIDTKFTNIVTKGRFDNTTFKSGYIYQLYAYIMSQKKEQDLLSLASSGMLLHPSVGEHYDEVVTIQGHQLRFCTVDLMAKPSEITKRLENLIL
ncbi:5-methylcytosine-specific restriction endonuclease system specificity protein McrC [Vibrio sp. 10N.286.48.C11]|uniref:5-methylcytosine restriction system specificity protein McrC n=1 Tax=Vibrio sp. 10N.286.48.C11 TaxID=3229698 RepID=UPI0035502021